MSNLKTTRKLSSNEAKQIVDAALKKLNARETRLPDRIWAWCVANFNPEKENMVESVYEEILKAATSGEGSDYSIGIANMIIEKHEYLTATRH